MFPNRPAAAWPTLVAQRGAGGLADPPASSLLSSAHSLSCSWGPCMPPRASSPYAFFLLCASPPRVHATEGAQTPTLYSLWDARGLCLLRSPGAPRRERRDLTAPACPALPNTERKTPNLPPGGRCSLASSRVRGEPQSRRETRKHWLPFPGPSPSPHRPLPKRSPALGCHSPARPAYWDSAGRRAARFPSPPPRTPPPRPRPLAGPRPRLPPPRSPRGQRPQEMAGFPAGFRPGPCALFSGGAFCEAVRRLS